MQTYSLPSHHPQGGYLVPNCLTVAPQSKGVTKMQGVVHPRASIPEYWVADINQRKLLVFRELEGGDIYQVEQVLEVTDAIDPVVF
jgi:hypothetical protein